MDGGREGIYLHEWAQKCWDAKGLLSPWRAGSEWGGGQVAVSPTRSFADGAGFV